MKRLLIFATIFLLLIPGTSFAGRWNESGSGIAEVSSDTTPKLGGPLDLNNQYVYDAANAFTNADTSPDVSGGAVFKTANSGATTIADFDDGTDHGTIVDGHMIYVLVQDGNTTFDFTSSQLTGNEGANWTAGDGDFLFCIFDDTTDADGQWLCAITEDAGAGGGAPADAQYLTLVANAGLTVERTFAISGAGLNESDGGAGNDYTISLDIAPSAGSATLIEEQDALQVKYDSTDFGEGANGLVLGASPTIATSLLIGSDDTSIGTQTLYGGGVGDDGGVINIYLGADDDATISHFILQVVEDDLTLGPNTDADALKLDAAKDLYLTDGDIYIQESGTTKIELDAANNQVIVGQDDTERGFFIAYGHATGQAQGGSSTLYLSADYDTTIAYYILQSYEDDLLIGPDTDTDVLKIAAGSGLSVTAGNFAVDSGTITASGDITSSGGSVIAQGGGSFDVVGAAALTLGSADVTVVTIQTDDTGDGTDLVLPAQSVNGSEMLNNTVTATQLSATITLADGDLVDLSGIIPTAATDEGLIIPTWVDVAPSTDAPFITYDPASNAIKVYEGGWVSISGGSGAPVDAKYIVFDALSGTLSAEMLLAESTQGIDLSAYSANGTLTISFDAGEIDAETWSDGANASNIWTFDVSGTDTTMTAGNGSMSFSHAVIIAGDLSLGAAPASTGGAVGDILMSNATAIYAEAAPASTDVYMIGVDSSEVVQIAASGASGVTITPNVTFSGAIASIGSASDLSGATVTLGTVAGTITDGTASWNTTNQNLSGFAAITMTGDLSIGANPADAGTGIRMSNASVIEFEDTEGTGEVTALTVDASEAIIIGDGNASGTTITPAVTLSGGIASIGGASDLSGATVTLGTVAGTITDGTASWDASAQTLAGFSNITSTKLTSTELEYSGNITIDAINAAANSTVTITNSDGTYVANLSVEGSITSTQTGDSFLGLTSNGSTPTGAGTNAIYYVSNVLKFKEGGSEVDPVTDADSPTWTGTTHDYSGVTNLLLPATADAASEIGVDDSTDILSLGIQDGAGAFISYDYTGVDGNDNYVMAWDEASNKFTAQAQVGGGGSPTWDAIDNPAAGQPLSLVINGGGETTTFTMSADNTEILYDFTAAFTTAASPDLFKIIQQTGNTEAVTLLTLQASDSDVTVLEAGNGASNAVLISQTGLMTFTGTAGILPLPTASDAQAIGSATHEYSDLFLADGAIIYGQNDQSNTITSSATGWAFAGDVGVGDDVLLADGAVVGITGNEVITFNAAGSIAVSGATMSVSGLITASGGVTLADSQTLTFDESAADPNDADVVLTGTDGVLKIAATNGAYNEGLSIDLDATENTIGLSSTTGATEINAGTLQFVTTGDIMGGINVSKKGGAYTVGTDDAHEAYGTLFLSDTSAPTFTLPTAVAGYSVCFMQGQGRTDIITVTPNTGDYLVVDGARGTAATAYASAGAADEKLCAVAGDADDWYVTSEVGTWSE